MPADTQRYDGSADQLHRRFTAPSSTFIIQTVLLSAPLVETLKAGEALGIDCVDIQTVLGGPQPVGNGVMIIQSGDDLKVIPAYTQLVPPLTTTSRP